MIPVCGDSPMAFVGRRFGKIPDRNIEKNRARFRQVANILDPMIHFDLPAKLTQIIGKCVRNLFRAAAGNWPPTACPASPSTSANADETGASSGRNECAAIPAKRARAGSLLKINFASNVAGQSARIPKCASVKGCCGQCNIGCRNSIDRFSQLRASGFIRRR